MRGVIRTLFRHSGVIKVGPGERNKEVLGDDHESGHYRAQHRDVVYPEFPVGDKDDAQCALNLYGQEPEDYDKKDDN